MKSIYVRNLDSKELIDTYLTFNLNDENKTEIYKSKISRESLNPTYDLDIGEEEFEKLLKMEKLAEFVVCIFNTENQNLFSCEVSFSTLKFFTDHLSSHVFKLPLNCIIIEFLDGYFIPESYFFKFNINCNINPKTKREIIPKISCQQLEKNMLEISKLKRNVFEITNNISKIKNEISSKLLSSNKRKEVIQQEFELKKKSCERLQKIINEKKIDYKRVTEKIKKNSNEINEIESNFLMCSKNLYLQTEKLKEKKKIIIPLYTSKLLQLLEKRTFRKKNIIQEIQKVYVVVNDGRNYSINNLKVYKPKTSMDKDFVLNMDEDSYAALGYVCHCVVMVSKILQIPIKYQLFPKSSRSFVMNNNKNFLPLFCDKKKQSEKEKFQRGVGLLNYNIYMLTKVILNSRLKSSGGGGQGGKKIRKKVEQEKNILKNLNRLLQICIEDDDE